MWQKQVISKLQFKVVSHLLLEKFCLRKMIKEQRMLLLLSEYLLAARPMHSPLLD